MPALIPELISMACDPAVSASDLLRRAQVAAYRLQQAESATWLQHELDGYPSLDGLPDYRRPRGVLHAIHPSGITTPLLVERTASAEVVRIAELLSVCPLSLSLRELEKLEARGESVRVRRQPENVIVFQQEFKSDLEPATVLTHGQVAGCLDAIRNQVLRWALALEAAGIKGENLSFSAQEQQLAQQVTHIHIEGGIHGGQVMVSSSGGKQQQTVTGEQKEAALTALLPWLQQVIEQGQLQQEAIDELQVELATLQAQAVSSKPKWPVIGAVAGSVLAILEGAGGGVLAGQALGWLATLKAG